ncbi:flagellar biosynthetic protein FliO [Paludisphaera soli]|uniref:flagellar biosynthetic protein FliO n=1 Tax=Paludisphaera soli TaxID=2712865 RepID=UPI0013EA0CA7|nr:flagellar biosynthetic protein FliO [Paludisphaera soli]
MERAKLSLLVALLLALATAPAASAQDVAAPQAVPARPHIETAASKKSRGASLAPGSQGWWLGTAFMVVVLGAAGVVCIAAKRQAVGGPSVKLQVVGRVSLPPKHAVFAVKAGDRTLLIGVGPQGAPALLGELDDEAVAEAPPPAARVAAVPPAHRPIASQSRFDVRIGDES